MGMVLASASIDAYTRLVILVSKFFQKRGSVLGLFIGDVT
jgi:hypothetical protein